jgi:hypothetical protein
MTFKLSLRAFLWYENGSGNNNTVFEVETSDVLNVNCDVVGFCALVTDTDSSSHRPHQVWEDSIRTQPVTRTGISAKLVFLQADTATIWDVASIARRR